mmetsp:Transcript_98215/g.311567  ORF Transcript_98215/g.311567 Transcript_98215/m.311567 type:complete len:512 (-) Transcript_98215:111-1646(-)
MGASCASTSAGEADRCRCAGSRCFSAKSPRDELLSATLDDLDEAADASHARELAIEASGMAMAPLNIRSVFESPGGAPDGTPSARGTPRTAFANDPAHAVRMPSWAWYACFIAVPLAVVAGAVLAVHVAAVHVTTTTTTTTTPTTTDTTTISTSATFTTITRMVSTTWTTFTTVTHTIATHTLSTTTTTPSMVTLAMTFQNLDYGGLMGRRQVCDEFKAAVQEVIASEAGFGVRARHVQLTLIAGSVEVKARIFQLSGDVADAVRTRMAQSGRLSERVVATVSAIPGVETVSTGPITVADVHAMSSNSPAVEAVGVPSRAGPGPQTFEVPIILVEEVGVVLVVLLLVAACAAVRSCRKRGYSQMGEAKEPAAEADPPAVPMQPGDALGTWAPQQWTEEESESGPAARASSTTRRASPRGHGTSLPASSVRASGDDEPPAPPSAASASLPFYVLPPQASRGPQEGALAANGSRMGPNGFGMPGIDREPSSQSFFADGDDLPPSVVLQHLRPK